MLKPDEALQYKYTPDNKFKRLASWWLMREDLDSPCKNRFLERADAFKDAGISAAVIFGAHFRWDFIEIFDRLHELLNYLAEILHQRGILLIDHHSANLVHRPRTSEGRREIMLYNRHHLPFYPDLDIASTLEFNGAKLDGWRMCSVKNNAPCFLERYQAEIFCMNNSGFQEAYKLYLKTLFNTGIDGLMCDDTIYYPGWDACGCGYCRELFRSQYGHKLPPANDAAFWGNFANPDFRDWIELRYHASSSFLKMVRKNCPEHNFPLFACCSGSIGKRLNLASAMSAKEFAGGVNAHLQELVGEVTSPKSYFRKLPSFMLHRAIAARKDETNIGLGYAHFPDPAFFIWAFNKLFDSTCYLSTLKGRTNLEDRQYDNTPCEDELLKPCFQFEKAHPELFGGESAAQIGVYYSFDTEVYYGSREDDYSTRFRRNIDDLFKHNIQFHIVEDSNRLQNYTVIHVPGAACLSRKEKQDFLKFLENGGTLFLSGAFGTRGKKAAPSENFMKKLGIDAEISEPVWRIFPADLFEYRDDPPPEKLEKTGKIVSGKRKISWFPESAWNLCLEQISDADKNSLVTECSPGYHYRIYHKNGRTLIHIMSFNFKSISHPKIKYNNGRPVIEKLQYTVNENDKIVIRAQNAQLYSPDLCKKQVYTRNEGQITIPLKTTTRYCIIKV